MGTVLLVTTHPQLIAEFETIAAVTGIDIRVAADGRQAAGATHVFLDPATDYADLIHPGVVIVTLMPAGPAAWAAAAQVNAIHIAELPRERDWVVSHIHVATTARGTLVSIEPVVGGAGASTLAVTLAHHLAKRGKRTALVDLDLDGALDVIVGLDADGGMRWPDLDLSTLGGADLAEILPSADGVAVLSSDVRRPVSLFDADAVTALLATCDVVIVDHPASTPDRVVLPEPDLSCVVLPNTVRAVAVAGRRLASHRRHQRGLVVRSVPGAGLDTMAVAEVLDTPVWASLPSDSRIVEQVEQGLGPSMIRLGGYTKAVLHLANRILGDDAAAPS